MGDGGPHSLKVSKQTRVWYSFLTIEPWWDGENVGWWLSGIWHVIKLGSLLSYANYVHKKRLSLFRAPAPYEILDVNIIELWCTKLPSKLKYPGIRPPNANEFCISEHEAVSYWPITTLPNPSNFSEKSCILNPIIIICRTLTWLPITPNPLRCLHSNTIHQPFFLFATGLRSTLLMEVTYI